MIAPRAHLPGVVALESTSRVNAVLEVGMQARQATWCLHAAAAVKAVCSEYRIHNADVYVRDDCVTVDDLVDVIEGSRVYVPAIYVINKIDQARAPAEQEGIHQLGCGHALLGHVCQCRRTVISSSVNLS